MLNKEDKKFIVQFVTQALAGLKKDLGGQIREVDERLSTEIRHNGVYIESVYDEVTSIAEDVSDFNRRTDRIEADLAIIKENTADLPAIRVVIKNHSRQLAALKK